MEYVVEPDSDSFRFVGVRPFERETAEDVGREGGRGVHVYVDVYVSIKYRN